MTDKRQAMVLASFIGDALSLGVHWIYDAEKIKQTHGRVTDYLKPAPGSYHASKDVGEFTHYGDQTLVLLESLADSGGFDVRDFSDSWRALFADYQGYFDGATKQTLAGYEAGKEHLEASSGSDDLAGASRIAPLVSFFSEHVTRLVEFARCQTQMTHNNPLTLDAAEFFARVSHDALNGIRPIDSMIDTVQEFYPSAPVAFWVQTGIDSREQDSVATIAKFGQSCHTPSAFPGVIHLLAKYENDLEEALIQSVMAGGDSAARSMIVGMVLGAWLGPESIPERWVTGLKARDRILSLMG